MGNPFKIKKLRLSVTSKIMTNRYLSKFKSCILKFLNHLYGYYSAVMFKLNLIKNTSSNQPKIAINIPNFNSKGQFYSKIIEITNDNSIPGVGPFYLVPLNYIGFVRQFCKKVCKFTNVILSIS